MASALPREGRRHCHVGDCAPVMMRDNRGTPQRYQLAPTLTEGRRSHVPAANGYDGSRQPPWAAHSVVLGIGVGQDSHRHAPATCPRCGRTLREPTAWSSAWRCDWHGEVHPLLPAFSPSRDGLDGLLRRFRPGAAGVPAWLPWPLPVGWLVTGSPALAMSAPASAPARWRCPVRTRSAARRTWWSWPRSRASASARH